MQPRVLIISLRKMGKAPMGYGALFEFEDAIQRFEHADRVDIVSNQDDWRIAIPHRINTAVRVLSGGRFGNTGPIPWPADVRLERDYDLAFFIVDGVFHMRLANLVRDIRKRCATMALYVQESWPADYEDRRIHTQPYQLFDHFFFDLDASGGRFQRHAKRPTHDLDVACDTLRFASGRPWQERMYDVAWVGRRDPATHDRILAMCERRKWRYYYDPFDSGWSSDPVNQRRWLGNLMGDSRFAISNFARANQPEVHRGQRHLASRFVEGVAAGNVLVGALPDSPAFGRCMNWEDSAFEANGAPEQLIEQLADQPDWMQSISRRNMAQGLRRHDWAHRWGQVLDTVGIARGARLNDYLAMLETRAQAFDDDRAFDDNRQPGTVPSGTVPAAVTAAAPAMPATAARRGTRASAGAPAAGGSPKGTVHANLV